MKACKVDEQQLAEWIDGASGAIRYLGPAITERLAQKILAAEKRTGQPKLLCWINRMMGEQETLQSAPDHDRQDIPAPGSQAPSEVVPVSPQSPLTAAC